MKSRSLSRFLGGFAALIVLSNPVVWAEDGRTADCVFDGCVRKGNAAGDKEPDWVNLWGEAVTKTQPKYFQEYAKQLDEAESRASGGSVEEPGRHLVPVQAAGEGSFTCIVGCVKLGVSLFDRALEVAVKNAQKKCEDGLHGKMSASSKPEIVGTSCDGKMEYGATIGFSHESCATVVQVACEVSR